MGLEIDRIPFAWVRRELRIERTLARGHRGKAVERVQEWLTLNKIAVVIDGHYGPATEYAVGLLQSRRGLPKTGAVDTATYAELTESLREALTPPQTPPASMGAAVVAGARRHLAKRPREVGGVNRGPWVRVYMEGHHGPDFLWCAGFASFMVRQAAWHMGVSVPLRPTFSCDVLSRDARAEGRFVSEMDIGRGLASLDDLPRGSLFVQRRTSNDWNHVGIVITAGEEVIETVEGNTNEGGSREGYEVCRRIRNLKSKDFITLQ